MQCTAQPTRSYRPLTPDERGEIMLDLRTGESLSSIANRLNRNRSVIWREVKNNSTEDGRYQCYWAQKRSECRRRSSRQRERIGDQRVRGYIAEKLELGWSPEQIAGRIVIDLPGNRVSHETIYQYVFKQDRSLTQYLQCGRKHRRRRRNRRNPRVMIPHRIGIEQRPEHIEGRSQPGHWEADTAVSRASKAALMVLQERSLGITLLRKLPRCAPTQMNAALEQRLMELPPQLRRSITFDNGQENRLHNQLCEQLGVRTYFCAPYSSWQKGSVENAVGLTRRVWPKKTDYALISDEEIAMVEHRLNTRPRKRFGYLTPLEHAAAVALSP